MAPIGEDNDFSEEANACGLNTLHNPTILVKI